MIKQEEREKTTETTKDGVTVVRETTHSLQVPDKHADLIIAKAKSDHAAVHGSSQPTPNPPTTLPTPASPPAAAASTASASVPPIIEPSNTANSRAGQAAASDPQAGRQTPSDEPRGSAVKWLIIGAVTLLAIAVTLKFFWPTFVTAGNKAVAAFAKLTQQSKPDQTNDPKASGPDIAKQIETALGNLSGKISSEISEAKREIMGIVPTAKSIEAIIKAELDMRDAPMITRIAKLEEQVALLQSQPAKQNNTPAMTSTPVDSTQSQLQTPVASPAEQSTIKIEMTVPGRTAQSITLPVTAPQIKQPSGETQASVPTPLDAPPNSVVVRKGDWNEVTYPVGSKPKRYEARHISSKQVKVENDPSVIVRYYYLPAWAKTKGEYKDGLTPIHYKDLEGVKSVSFIPTTKPIVVMEKVVLKP